MLRKKLSLIAATVFMLSIISVNVFATSENILKNEDKNIYMGYDETEISFLPYNINDNSVEMFSVDACPGRGDHEMHSRGFGTLIEVNGSNRRTVFAGGAAWQCRFCNEVLVTEYDPLEAGYVGYYCMRNPMYPISPYGIVLEAPPESIRFTSGSRVPYCRLFY